MEQEVEVEWYVLAGVVHAHVHVELLFSQDEAVADSEGTVPHGAGVVAVCQAEDGFNVAGVKAVRTLFQLPSGGQRKKQW